MKKETISSFEENGVVNIELIIETYNSYIYKILKNSISKEQDIEEILSDVFMIFWKNYKKLDKYTEVKPYLIGITKNLIYKKYREYSVDFENIELYENDMTYNMNVEELVENKEKSKIISDSLVNMKEIDKKVFMMFYYNQIKIKEISKTLKISEAKVKIILHRTRKIIKKNLFERGYSYGK